MGDPQDIRLTNIDGAEKTTQNGSAMVQNGAHPVTNGAEFEKQSGERGKLSRAKDSCVTCMQPCLVRFNPLPEDANIFERFTHALRMPPHGRLATYIQFVTVCVCLWVVLYCLTPSEALPGGNLYSLLALFVCCAVGGYLISFLHLPPLLGMLLVGVLLRNVPGVKFVGESIDPKWGSTLRKVALTVILTRAGLGLDVVKLRKLSFAVIRLAFLPCTAEILTASVVSKFLLDLPWPWALMLGCILGALSPAVTVPALVSLQDRKYGVAKGIPTMLLAAGGLDNVLCVTGFSVFMGIVFSEGELAVTIIKGPIGVLVGIAYGFLAGFFLWFIPAKDSANPVFYRYLLLLSAGLIAIFGSSRVGLSGAGPLGCLTTATVAAYKWRQRRQPGETDEVAGVMALTWLIMQHFLFGLIGAAVDISHIQSQTAGLGIATLAIGLVMRSLVSSTVTMGTGFNRKERVFVTLTWLAKATVQAAIGGLALDRVMEDAEPSVDNIRYATDILTISVLAIVICAPIGATLISVLGPKFLFQGEYEEEEELAVVTEKPSKGDKSSIPETPEVAEFTPDKRSLHGSRGSLDDEVFRSELSLVLRKRSEVAENLGIDNPAFGHKTRASSGDVSNEILDVIYDEVADSTRKDSDIGTDVDNVFIDSQTEQPSDNEADNKNVDIENAEPENDNTQAVGQFKTVIEVKDKPASPKI
ncbi:sodium/hydrogen exchanger 9B2-like isoform X2 [Mya arenaria]|uniref:sodium/hydrogen exchanger 9B2-like isoform X2 n=1 Tax=Mya arenaria TaxID=6604 RepID=UPI0022E248CB|nr:sodium/hydrogen exchanger 9B2-like isoform X2 [Mya arenaria]